MTVPRARSSGAVRRAPTPQATEPFTLPSPVGMNAMSPLAAMDPTDCIYTYNLLPYEFGMRSREGYVEWANGFAGSSVRTIIPFVGDREDRFNDRLFAFNDQGIFDVTSQGVDTVSPPSVYTWVTTGDVAGYGIYTHFTNDGGEHSLIVADERNGLVEWIEGAANFTLLAGITGPADPTDIFFITAHQNRLWLVEKNTSYAWYLPTGAKAGAATRFNFGANFREGGTLVGLYSWTVDGGDGVDDYMVAVTREGGVVIYRGNDPANASTWSLVGVWYIGRVPDGHRVASQYGGQLFILSEHGLININRLLAGGTLEEAANLSTGKITRLVRDELNRTKDLRGWEIRVLASESLYFLNVPLEVGVPPLAFVKNLTTGGWGLWRGPPMATGDIFQGRLFFADNDGSVWVHDGTLDNVLLDGTPGVEIEFSMLTSFQGQGGFRRAHFCRPYFLSVGLPSFSVQARYDYNLEENNGALPFQSTDASLWDTALWDVAVWEGGLGATSAIRGLTGLGHVIAIALRGRTAARTTLVQIEVQVDEGGPL